MKKSALVLLLVALIGGSSADAVSPPVAAIKVGVECSPTGNGPHNGPRICEELQKQIMTDDRLTLCNNDCDYIVLIHTLEQGGPCSGTMAFMFLKKSLAGPVFQEQMMWPIIASDNTGLTLGMIVHVKLLNFLGLL